MPQKKKSQEFFGVHRALAFHPEINKFLAKWPGVVADTKDFLLLVYAASHETFFRGIQKPIRLHWVELFGKLYARNPDAVLQLMCLVRRVLGKWSRTQSGQIITFLYTHHSILIDTRQPQYNENGQRIAVIVKNKLTGSEKRIVVSNLTSEEIECILRPKIVAVNSLQDKELAHLLNVSSDSVKKARQEVAKMNAKTHFWESPDIVLYMKTGKMTPALKRFKRPS